MNIKQMRNIHLYLGVFFSPLLLFFLITGCLQTFQLHEQHRSDPSYKPPALVQAFAQVHKDQRWMQGDLRARPSQSFRILVLLMGIGLAVTTVLGIIMAFKYTRPWIVWACLIGGFVIPCLFLWLAFVRTAHEGKGPQYRGGTRQTVVPKGEQNVTNSTTGY